MQEKLRQHIEKIVSLTDEEFDFVRSHFSVKQAKKKTFLFQTGESVRYSYFVVSGLLTLIYHDDTGKQHIVSFAMEDWWESANAKERYEQLLQRYPALLQRVPNTLLASYLGVSRETLSRLWPSS
nr:cyclic nucleotide-binding domain-containing protein [uncultured Chitinophaga sp.]